jgi:ABC-type transport system involved in multi-copper enzyme maturation permease subunit
MSLASAAPVWLRRTAAWAGSRQTWAGALGGTALVAGAAALVWFSDSLPVLVQAALWAVYVAAAVLLERWLLLFGPVFFYDMVRSARRGRYILLRCAYACLLLLVLFWVFTTAFRYHDNSLQTMSQLAESYFESIMLVQLLAVLLLTPVYVAGAIADEKERRTLEYLLATDLRNREIVLSKLAARLANLSLLILTGLPILSAVQFLGGVDPNLVLTGFAATALTMLGLAGVSILQSTYARRPRDAIALTYLVLVGYYVLSFLLLAVDNGRGALGAFHAGNLLYLLMEVQSAGYLGTLATTLPELLRGYALFQGVVAVLCCGWSLLRLRAVAVRQLEGGGRGVRGRGQIVTRPPVGLRPMMWKEIWVEGGIRLGCLSALVLFGLVLASFYPVWLILVEYHDRSYVVQRSQWEGLAQAMNIWVRVAGSLVACLLLLWVAVRASTCVSRERDQQTLDGLLISPLDSDDILWAKCVGNVLGVRWLWLWLGAIWLLGVLTGGLHVVALVIVVVAWFVYAAAVSALGTWFSVVSRTGLRATTWTLLATGALGVGHWLIWLCCGPLLMFGSGSGEGLAAIMKFQGGLTPPVALFFVQFPATGLGDRYSVEHEFMEMVAYSLFGLCLWALLAFMLWNGASARFRELTNRLRGWERDVPFGQPRVGPRPPEPAAGPRPPAAPWGAVLVEKDWQEPPEDAPSP